MANVFLLTLNVALAPVVDADSKEPPCAVLLFPITHDDAATVRGTSDALATDGRNVNNIPAAATHLYTCCLFIVLP